MFPHEISQEHLVYMQLHNQLALCSRPLIPIKHLYIYWKEGKSRDAEETNAHFSKKMRKCITVQNNN